MIRRKKYIDKIKPFIDKPVIKAITGIRRCGKSTLLKQIANEIELLGVNSGQIININKELFEFDFIQTYTDLHNYISKKASHKNKKYYLFIDEIQEIDEWEKAISSFFAEKKYDIYISGSNAHLLSSDLATLITGRYIEFKIYTFTFSEFKEIYEENPKINKNIDVFSEFVKYGGFPGIHSFNWSEEILRQYLESIYNTVVLKDVVMRNQIKDVSMLNYILDFIAQNCGNITTAKSIHDLYGKKVLETFEKYYLGDTGLGFALHGSSPEMISGQLENIVLLELLSRGYKVNIGKNKNKEIDFIASIGADKIYIQICKTLIGEKVNEREYGAFEGLNDHYPKYVLSLDEFGFNTDKNGVKWMNIKDFLMSSVF